MSNNSPKESSTEEIVSSIHRFSYPAFDLAKLLVAGGDPEPLKEQARNLEALFPEFVAQKREADEEYQADLNNVLSEAGLDLDYVLAGGGRPSSIRLGHVIREQSAGGQSS